MPSNLRGSEYSRSRTLFLTGLMVGRESGAWMSQVQRGITAATRGGGGLLQPGDRALSGVRFAKGLIGGKIGAVAFVI